MLKVRTRLAKSTVHGIGLFADELIPGGMVVWEFDPCFDVVFSREDLDALSCPARAQVEKYSYFERELGAYVLCGDDARFMNHCAAPNTAEARGMRTLAARAIAVGEEITCDYASLSEAPTTGPI